MEEFLKDIFEKYSISYTTEMLSKFNAYYKFLITENEKFNLTAITEEKEVALKHFLDSVLPANIIPQNATVLDIGAGAGFPSVPLKILRPDLKVVMLDSLQKRIKFLNETIELLQLKNITAVHSRAEDYAKLNREKFDIVVARAVANLSTLSEYCLPFVKIGGMFIAYKGTKYEEEIAEAKNCIKVLGGEITDIQKQEIQELDGTRANIIITKKFATNKIYPRGKNLPKTNPIK